MAKDCAAELSMSSVRSQRFRAEERMELARQIAFWRSKEEATTDPIRLASYARIIADLVALAERVEVADA